jgi:hypothetical protein
MTNSESAEEQPKSADRHSNTNIEGTAAPPREPSIAGVPPPPTQPTDPNRGDRRRTPWWKKVLDFAPPLITFGLLLVNIYQMRATKEAANAAESAARTAEDSFKFTRTRVEANDEATLSVLSYTDFVNNAKSALQHLSISSTGNVLAKDFRAHLEFTRNSLPSNKRLALLYTLDISEDEVRKDTPITKTIVLPALGKREWEKVQQTREAVVTSGTLQYDNGFGTIKHRQFCEDFVTGGVTSVYRVECDRLPEIVDRVKREKGRK